MANINRVEFTETALYVHLSDGTFRPGLYTQANLAFLYHATPQQRANWQLVQRDKAISWPDLNETLLLGDRGDLVRYAPEQVAAPELVAELV